MRSALLIWCLIAVVCPSIAPAQECLEWVEPVPGGHINWTNGLLVVKGMAFPQPSAEHDDIADLSRRARLHATQRILNSFNFIKMDAQTSVADHTAGNPVVRDKLEEMAAQAPVLHKKQVRDGGLEIAVSLALRTGFSQLTLPASIKQVDNIKAVAGVSASDQPNESQLDGNADPDVYSGLVVDARGIGAKPALVPVLTDEDGQEVFGPTFISRDYAVQQGVCAYAKYFGDGLKGRVGAKPLLAKGLRTLDGRPCDIVISRADASKIRGASSHLDMLKQCRVVILLD